MKNKHIKIVNSIIKTIKINKEKISDISVGWKNRYKEEPKLLSIDRAGKCEREKVEYLKIELYLKYPLK